MILVSAAKRIGLDIEFIVAGRSLIFLRKSKGPSTEPCGTPRFTIPHSE
jgi:hypothetical protein